MLTAERLHEVLQYDADSGVFTRIDKRQKKVGTVSTKGYLCICVDYRIYKAARLAWLYMTGRWPENQIDHRDNNRLNNAWANLRDVDNTGNQQNRTEHPERSATGAVGVQKLGDRYRAKISVQGKRLHLGMFDTVAAADAAYREAKIKHHIGV